LGVFGGFLWESPKGPWEGAIGREPLRGGEPIRFRFREIEVRTMGGVSTGPIGLFGAQTFCGNSTGGSLCGAPTRGSIREGRFPSSGGVYTPGHLRIGGRLGAGEQCL